MKKQPNRPCLAADQKGFVSMYAVLLLQIVIIFSAAIMLRSKSLIMSRKSDDLIDIYIIHHVKEIFETDYPKTESLSWKNYEIEITYEDLTADVRYTSSQGKSTEMRIEYDDICMCIMKTAYPEKTLPQ